MKIKTIAVKVLKVPLDQPYTADGRAVGANWHAMAEVTTEDGITGFGYIVALNGMFGAPGGGGTRELAPLVAGMSVAEPEAAWKKMASAGGWIGPGGLLHFAIA